MMLKSLGENRGPVNVILRMIKKEDLSLTLSDWNLLRDVVKFLSKFKSVVTHLSAQKVPTMNLALLFRAELRSCLENDEDDPLPVAGMKNEMLARLDHRFPVTDLVVTAALLDPRFQNLDDIDRFIAQEGTTKVEFLAGEVLKRVTESDVNPTTTNTSSAETRETGGEEDLVALARKHSRNQQRDDTRTKITAECQAFLTSSMSSVQEGDLLKYRRERSCQFPWLAALARAILCVPATSTASERVFSVDGLLVNAKRSRLAPQTVNRVTFIHDNYAVCKDVLD